MVSERHLRRLLTAYLTYYHGARTHLALQKDAPTPRRVQTPTEGPWSRSRNVADYIIATRPSPPDRAQSTLASNLTSNYVSARSGRACAPRGFKAIVFVTASTVEASTTCRNRFEVGGSDSGE